MNNLIKQIKEHRVLSVIALLMSALIIIKFGIIVYILLIIFYYLVSILLLAGKALFHPKHPYHKFKKFIRGCFALDDEIWLDESLSGIFDSLTEYCRQNGRKIILFSEQIETFSRKFKDDPDIKVFDRIAGMQKAKVINILPPAKAPTSKPNPFSEYFDNDPEQNPTQIGIIYEAPLPPKPPKNRKEFFKAITYYSKKCQDMSYVSKDPEIKVRVTDYSEKNPENRINILLFKDFKSSFDYIDMFKPPFHDAITKAKRAKNIKRTDRKKQMENVVNTVTAISKAAAEKRNILNKLEKEKK